jgi:hypothetical protein
MPKTPAKPVAANVAITLNAVLAAVDDQRPKVLCVGGQDAVGLPYGLFDPERHRTFEIGVREWVTRQTHLSLGYVEQLYTFGDKGREAPLAAIAEETRRNRGERVVSVGYLALAPDPADVSAEDAGWRDWYGFFPWEDWRGGEPQVLRERIIPALSAWAEKGENPNARRARAAAAFGLDGSDWDEAGALDRYELMYEAGLVAEAWRDRRGAGLEPPKGDEPKGNETGTRMISDHRRILATAVGRLRGKLRYRPIIFEMTPPEFTLLQLQQTVEAIVGFEFHKQNFRRSVEKSGFVKHTGETVQQTGGRPAALFTPDPQGLRAHAAAGLVLPRLRRDVESLS